VRAGDVFRFVGIADIHVWAIISDPARDPLKLLIVNFTTWEPHLDQACIIEAGEHPFIIHKTLNNYARARIVPDAALEQLRSAGRLQLLDESLSQALLTKMRESAMNSITLPLEAGDILMNQELVD
jgi:hypothetical protein